MSPQKASVVRRRGNKNYSRKGCLQCKKAHTKCNEVKPVCTRCTRLKLACVYQSRTEAKIIHLYNNESFLNQTNTPAAVVNPVTTTSNTAATATAEPVSKDITFVQHNNFNKTPSTLGAFVQDWIQNEQSHTHDTSTFLFDVSKFFIDSDIHLLTVLNFTWNTRRKLLQTHLQTSSIDTSTTLHDPSFLRELTLETLLKNDPIKYVVENSPPPTVEHLNILNSLDLADEILVRFCWDVVGYVLRNDTFNLLPNTIFHEILLNFNSIFHNHTTFIVNLAACFLKSVYQSQGNTSLSNVWDRYIRLPSLEVCQKFTQALFHQSMTTNNLNIITSSNDTMDFMLLSNFAIFLYKANNYNDNFNWRRHINELLRLLKFTEDLYKLSKPKHKDVNLINSFYFIKTFICGSEILDWIFCDNGGSISNEIYLKYLFNNKNLNYRKFWLVGNKFNCLSGYMVNMFPILKKIIYKIYHLKKQNILIGGHHIFHLSQTFHLTNVTSIENIIESKEKISSSTHSELKHFGKDILTELETCIASNETQSTLSNIQGETTRTLLLSSQNIIILTISLYIKAFFINDPMTAIAPKIQTLLQLWDGLPQDAEITGTILIWTLYVGGLISIKLQQEFFLKQFYTLLTGFTTRYVRLASRFTERLRLLERCKDAVNSIAYDDFSCIT